MLNVRNTECRRSPVLQFPEGTAWDPEDELKAVIESQTLEDLPRTNHGVLLNDLYPWGMVLGELQFIIVPPDCKWSILYRLSGDAKPSPQLPKNRKTRMAYCSCSHSASDDASTLIVLPPMRRLLRPK